MPTPPPHRKCAEIAIGGMTCESCALLLEHKLKGVPGVVEVEIDHRTGAARITAETGKLPNLQQIEEAVKKAGYHLSDERSSSAEAGRQWLEVGAMLIGVLAIGKILSAFHLVSLAPSAAGALTFGGVFVMGLVAGTSSCLAVTGGLLLGMATKYSETHQEEAPRKKLLPLLWFNAGRLISYAILGGVIGGIGHALTLSVRMTGILNIVVAFLMLAIGLSLLHVLPAGWMPRLPKALTRRITDLLGSDHPFAPASLGALTFFLPCGFTQSLQLAALASGSFAQGALIMGGFALGTSPSLIGISAVSAWAHGEVSRIFLRFSAVVVVLLALLNLQSGLVLAGIPLPQFAALPPSAAAQDITMKVTSSGYQPSHFTIQSGKPVHWEIDGEKLEGCTSVLVIPDLNISRPLSRGKNVIEFTAPHPGQLAFSCSMGMVRGSFTVL